MFETELSLGATAQLYWEHRVIEVVAACASRMGSLLRAGADRRKDAAFVMRFFDGYMHAWHFVNEERYFVPVLRTMGTGSAQRAAEHLTDEHGQCHAGLKELRALLEHALEGDRAAAASFDEGLPAYLDLVMSHLRKEDRYLYGLLQRALSSPAQRHLGWVLRHEPVGEGRDGQPAGLEAEARELAARYGVPFPAWDQTLEGLEAACGGASSGVAKA